MSGRDTADDQWIVIARAADGVGCDYIGPFASDGAAGAWRREHPERDTLLPVPLFAPSGGSA